MSSMTQSCFILGALYLSPRRWRFQIRCVLQGDIQLGTVPVGIIPSTCWFSWNNLAYAVEALIFWEPHSLALYGVKQWLSSIDLLRCKTWFHLLAQPHYYLAIIKHAVSAVTPLLIWWIKFMKRHVSANNPQFLSAHCTYLLQFKCPRICVCLLPSPKIISKKRRFLSTVSFQSLQHQQQGSTKLACSRRSEPGNSELLSWWPALWKMVDGDEPFVEVSRSNHDIILEPCESMLIAGWLFSWHYHHYRVPCRLEVRLVENASSVDDLSSCWTKRSKMSWWFPSPNIWINGLQIEQNGIWTPRQKKKKKNNSSTFPCHQLQLIQQKITPFCISQESPLPTTICVQ